MPMNEIQWALDDLVLDITHIEAGSCMSPGIISDTDSIGMKLPALKWAHPDHRRNASTAFLPEASWF